MGSQKRIPARRECFVHLGLDGVAWTPNRFLVGFHLAEALGKLASSIGPGFIASGANRVNDPFGSV